MRLNFRSTVPQIVVGKSYRLRLPNGQRDSRGRLPMVDVTAQSAPSHGYVLMKDRAGVDYLASLSTVLWSR